MFIWDMVDTDPQGFRQMIIGGYFGRKSRNTWAQGPVVLASPNSPIEESNYQGLLNLLHETKTVAGDWRMDKHRGSPFERVLFFKLGLASEPRFPDIVYLLKEWFRGLEESRVYDFADAQRRTCSRLTCQIYVESLGIVDAVLAKEGWEKSILDILLSSGTISSLGFWMGATTLPDLDRRDLERIARRLGILNPALGPAFSQGDPCPWCEHGRLDLSGITEKFLSCDKCPMETTS